MRKEITNIKMQVCAQDTHEIFSECYFPLKVEGKPILSNEKITVRTSGFFNLKKAVYNDFSFFDYSAIIKEDLCFHFETRNDTLCFLFCDKGCACLKNKHLCPCNFCCNEFNLYYLPGNTDFVIDSEKGKNNRYFGLFISKEMFTKIAQMHPYIFDKMKAGIKKNKCFSLFNDSVFISHEAAQVFHELKRCSTMDSTAPLFIGAKIQELFAFIFSKTNHQGHPDVTFDTRIKVYKARNILEKQYQNPPSIKKLATSVGTNSTTLKENFKKLFNTTIFDYVSNYRMDKAKDLLLNDSKQNIMDIAIRTGYESQSNFSTAFKRKFDVTPGKFRQQYLTNKKF